MSMMRCSRCDFAVDTDDEPESLYIIDGKCLCANCRADLEAEAYPPEAGDFE